jgi:hypothetical protein
VSRGPPLTAGGALAALAVLTGPQVLAGAAAQEARLEGRLDPATRSVVEQVVDSARDAGLPTDPLVAKALEGAAKEATGPRIIGAVRTLAVGLGAARAALGPVPPPDLVAAAEALRAGVSADALAELRSARPRESLLTPLAVLSDLISRGVPADTAAAAVLQLAGRGASDAEFGSMQAAVEHDIRAGAPPGSAASVRSGSEGPGGGGGLGSGGGRDGPGAAGAGGPGPHGDGGAGNGGPGAGGHGPGEGGGHAGGRGGGGPGGHAGGGHAGGGSGRGPGKGGGHGADGGGVGRGPPGGPPKAGPPGRQPHGPPGQPRDGGGRGRGPRRP